jgi:filamentous hemagglutinin
VTGSDILAGGAVSLRADGAVNLSAAQNMADLHGANSGSSASIGIGINFGGSQNGISFNASASKSRGNAEGTDLAWSMWNRPVLKVDFTLVIREIAPWMTGHS